MKIAIIHSSRGRPKECLETVLAWLKCAPIGYYQYYLGIEDVDRSEYLNTTRELSDKVFFKYFKTGEKKRLELVDIDNGDVIGIPEAATNDYYTGNTKGLALAVEAQNRYSPDWFVCAADNVTPETGFWENLLPIMYSLRDDHSPRVFVYKKDAQRGLVSHAIFNRAWFAEHGEIHYCGYYHLFGDNELYLRSLLDGSLFVMPDNIKKNHKHVCFGTAAEDDQFRTSNHKNLYYRDGQIFKRRREAIIKKWVAGVCQ